MTLPRRTFIKNTVGAVLTGMAIPSFPEAKAHEDAVEPVLPKTKGLPLRWLDGHAPARYAGHTFTTPWSAGDFYKDARFELQDTLGNRVAVQSWPLAYWPDKSVKWFAHSIGGDLTHLTGDLRLVRSEKKQKLSSIAIVENAEGIAVDTGMIYARFNKQGNFLLEELKVAGKGVGKRAYLQMMTQNVSDTDWNEQIHKVNGYSEVQQVSVENKGGERVVVKVEGVHDLAGKKKFPFVLRFYIYRNSPTLKLVHTFLYDGDEHEDFIKGIGLSFEVVLGDEAQYNRHVRFSGNDGGIFAESVQNLTGLRRDPGASVRNTQVAGGAVRLEEISERVTKGLPYIPVFADYTLSQLSSQSFAIDKRTAVGHAWIHATEGTRADGLGYLGSPQGGLAIGIRDFWKNYPAQLDITQADKEVGLLTAWLWSPRAPAMDLRFYHDGMGQDTYEKQWEGLEITYEDYEEGYGTPHGIAKTSELYLTLFATTPSNEEIAKIAKDLRNPSILMVYPQTLAAKGVFGANWGIADRSNDRLRTVEDRLDQVFDFYQGEVDRRGWYGYWNYGDVMHSYDTDRHQWRYDVGGYAWDNSELSTDLWLWYYFLRSGKATAFRFAEAMCRHTGEVDVYHLGRFAPLGSRHNVQHWGCSAKQLRISTAINRRFYYYLTGDERTGDLLREQVEAVRKLNEVAPLRKRLQEPLRQEEHKVLVGFGTDWGAIAAAWFTEWERTLDANILTRLRNSMSTIASQPKGFFTGGSYLNINTGSFERVKHNDISVSHLSAVFGLVEICQEMVRTISDKQFEQAWIQYCAYYNAPVAERERELGTKAGRFGLNVAHARLTAYAAAHLEDADLAQRAWTEFFSEEREWDGKVTDVHQPNVIQKVVEWPNISTNFAAQWSLSAMQCLHFAGKQIK